jgi:dihydroflavonol-4-reductase
LLAAVRKHQARLAYVSSFTTLVRPREGLASWRSQVTRWLHPYFAVKDHIESQVLAAAQHGLPAVIVNPTMCIGPWDVRERDLCFIPRLLCGELPGAVRQVLNVIDVRDVAEGIVAALHAERWGEPFLLSGHNLPADTLFSWICEVGGVKPPRFVASATVSLVVTYGLETLQTFLGQTAAVPSLAVMLACEHEWLTPGRAQEGLDITPRPLSETLRDAVEWYRELGYC